MTLWKRQAVSSVVLFALLVTTTGCGLILKPERRTEPLSKTKDTTTVVYDCLWLLAGVIPGVVALVVDATQDTWYYTQAELKAREGS